MKLVNVIWKTLCGALVLVSSVGCVQETLAPLGRYSVFNAEPARAEVNFCTIRPTTKKPCNKFIFVMDKSGSNAGTRDPQFPTDLCGDFRYKPLKTFTKDPDVDQSSTWWTIINFSTDATFVAAVDRIPGSRNGFTSDPAAFSNVLDGEHYATSSGSACTDANGGSLDKPTDGGWTNYIAALEKVYDRIHADVLLAQAEDEITTCHYQVVFASDGIPQIGENDIQTEQEVADPLTKLTSLPSRFKPYVGSVSINTVYYFHPAQRSDEAARRLRNMAALGNGVSTEAGGQAIDFTQFRVPERNVKHTLENVFVTNINTVWRNGAVLLDSDADNLPDTLELELGSDPFNADSDNNSIPDGVEYASSSNTCENLDSPFCEGDKDKEFDHPCGDNKVAPFCEPSSPDTFTVGPQFCSEAQKTLDRDNDDLTDCVEVASSIGLGSRADLWDSNTEGDWIPDRLAFRRGVALKGGSDAFLDTDNDRWASELEVKFFTPLRMHNDRVIGLRPYKYKLDLLTEDSQQNCYRLQVDDIAVLGSGNNLRVYIVEGTSVVDDQRFMRRADKPVSEGGRVVFTDSDF